MAENRIKSSNMIEFIQEIIDKKFNVVNKGYDPNGVDETLDAIFDMFSNFIKLNDSLSQHNLELKKEIEDLKKEVLKLKESNSSYKSQLDKMEQSGITMNAINNRLNKLEDVQNNKTRSSRISTKKI